MTVRVDQRWMRNVIRKDDFRANNTNLITERAKAK